MQTLEMQIIEKERIIKTGGRLFFKEFAVIANARQHRITSNPNFGLLMANKNLQAKYGNTREVEVCQPCSQP